MPTLRRRREEKAVANSEEQHDEGAHEKARRKAWRDLLVVLSVFIMLVLGMFGYLTHRLGFAFFLPQSMKVLSLDEDAVRRQIADHTFLFVGGPHRGGTTLVWRCLRTHPSISGFADRVGSDYSEGIFMQSVYPTFGIGGETALAPNKGGKKFKGLGRYAFNPEAHLTETSELVSPASRTRLFNEWGYFWNLSRPVLLEKSPPNMLTSRFLQQMFTPPLPTAPEPVRPRPGLGGIQLAPAGTCARFVFVTRHPVANALALAKWTGSTDVFEAVLHWLESHETLAKDLPHLAHSRVITLETFAQNPNRHLKDIYSWMGLENGPLPPTIGLEPAAAAKAAAESAAAGLPRVDPLPNLKYETQYCQWVARGTANLGKHLRMVKRLNERVQRLGYGYDLEGFDCLAGAVDHALAAALPPA